MKSLQEYTKECYTIAVELGWWNDEDGKFIFPPMQQDRFYEIISLFHSEVSEALEEYRNHHAFDEIYYNPDKPSKPEGIPIEIVDLLIRIFDYCGYTKQKSIMTSQENKVENFKLELCELHYLISALYYYNKHSMYDGRLLDELVIKTFHICEKFNIPIEKALELKIEYNKTRPYRHGNKKC